MKFSALCAIALVTPVLAAPINYHDLELESGLILEGESPNEKRDIAPEGDSPIGKREDLICVNVICFSETGIAPEDDLAVKKRDDAEKKDSPVGKREELICEDDVCYTVNPEDDVTLEKKDNEEKKEPPVNGKRDEQICMNGHCWPVYPKPDDTLEKKDDTEKTDSPVGKRDEICANGICLKTRSFASLKNPSKWSLSRYFSNVNERSVEEPEEIPKDSGKDFENYVVMDGVVSRDNSEEDKAVVKREDSKDKPNALYNAFLQELRYH